MKAMKKNCRFSKIKNRKLERILFLFKQFFDQFDIQKYFQEKVSEGYLMTRTLTFVNDEDVECKTYTPENSNQIRNIFLSISALYK